MINEEKDMGVHFMNNLKSSTMIMTIPANGLLLGIYVTNHSLIQLPVS